MKLRTKIISGFAAIGLIGLLLGVAGLVSTSLISSLSSEQDALQESYREAANVLKAHYEWRQSLTMAVTTGTEFAGATDPTACALGKWLASDSSVTDDPQLNRLFLEVHEPHDFIHNDAARLMALLDGGSQQEAEAIFLSETLPKTNETVGLIEEIEMRYAEIIVEKTASIDRVENMVTIFITALLVVAMAGCLALAFVIIRSIMRPIQELTEYSDSVAAGLLDVNFQYNVDDEIGQLGNSFLSLTQEMRAQAEVLAQLADGDYTASIRVRSDQDVLNNAINVLCSKTRQALQNVRSIASQVSTGAHQVAYAATNLSTGASEQAATLEQFTATIEEIHAMADKNADIAGSALSDTRETSQVMLEGLSSMEQMVSTMKEIDQSSQNIGTVIKIIDDIAFQTNILALNAAVEAARAGTHGKGFAVVADEVRNLASKSADAAKETSALIEKSTQYAVQGGQIVNRVNQDLKTIGDLADKNVAAIQAISEASLQQSQAMSEVSIGINQLSAVVQSNSATAEETAASSEEMSAQAASLDQVVQQFRLDAEASTEGKVTPEAPQLPDVDSFALA